VRFRPRCTDLSTRRVDIALASASRRGCRSLTTEGTGARDTLARAGGRDTAKLPDAITAAREAIEAALRG